MVIIDEIGYTPISRIQANKFFTFISETYQTTALMGIILGHAMCYSLKEESYWPQAALGLKAFELSRYGLYTENIRKSEGLGGLSDFRDLYFTIHTDCPPSALPCCNTESPNGSAM